MTKGLFRSTLKPAILVQLSLRDFLITTRQISILRQRLPILTTSSASITQRRIKNAQKELKEQLLKLVAPADETVIQHPWTPPQGTLSKLRHNARLLANSLPDCQEAQSFRDAIDRAWEAGKLALESSLMSEIQKFVKAISRIARSLSPLLAYFREDENVLFFLLRHQSDFEELIGEGYLQLLFTQLHPSGTNGIKHFMLKRYKQRGFTQLLSQIQELSSRL